jgi:SAM-dependent methyltransferase
LVEIAERRDEALRKLVGHDDEATPLTTARGLQQASDAETARYKAERFPAGEPVFDVCCGVGGDAIALAQRGPVAAVDSDPRMVRYVAFNLGEWGGRAAAAICQEAAALSLARNAWLHVDPDRRTGERRTAAPERSQPPADVVAAMMRHVRGGAIKLAPAATIPAVWPGTLCREWISRAGTCRQQVVWFGAAARAERVATIVSPHRRPTRLVVSEREALDAVCESTDNRAVDWLFDFDPAVRAAGLSGALAARLGLRALGGPAGFFAAESLPAATEAARYAGLVAAFRTLWSGSWQEKTVRRQLRAIGCTALEIKTRGVDLQPETLRRRLLGRKEQAATTQPQTLTLLLGADSQRRRYAALAERVPFC